MLAAIRRVCRPFIGTRAFYMDALRVMIPVAIQQLINNLFNVVDNLMVGSLDVSGLAMSAVSVANKPYTVFCGVFFGMTGAAGLMISQYYGAKDRQTCQGLFALQLVLGAGVSLLFCTLLSAFPEPIMRIFVTDPKTIDLGVRYMRVVCLSYIPMAVSNTCIFSMRALGKNQLSMLVSLGTMVVNAVCNYALIFGKLGMPAMGVEGAAYGTLIARVLEMCLYLCLLMRKRMVFTLDVTAFLLLKAGVIKSFFIRAVPLIANEVLWTMGLNVFFWCYARLDEASLPALTIAELGSLISSVLATGTASAVSVLIGTELGANRLQQAKKNCKQLLTLDVAIGVLCAGLCCTLAVLLPRAYNLSSELRHTATSLMIIMGVLIPLQFVYGFCFYCLRAGGDTKNAMLLDSGYLWVLPVPVAILMGALLPGKLPLTAAVLIVQFLMYAKVVIALCVLKRGKWVRNITVSS